MDSSNEGSDNVPLLVSNEDFLGCTPFLIHRRVHVDRVRVLDLPGPLWIGRLLLILSERPFQRILVDDVEQLPVLGLDLAVHQRHDRLFSLHVQSLGHVVPVDLLYASLPSFV